MTEDASNKPEQLTHLAADGSARMVDVGDKTPTTRIAHARSVVRMSTETARAVAHGDAPKGDVIGTARLAGVLAAKRVPELIPLAHPLLLDKIDVDIAVDVDAGTVTIESTVRTHGRTGVEIEAMTACSVSALTIYDMVKGIERGVTIERTELLEKSGGRNDWKKEED
jgi:cyclic pyranopterin phosphate synthase